jgi:hypothetical protein
MDQRSAWSAAGGVAAVVGIAATIAAKDSVAAYIFAAIAALGLFCVCASLLGVWPFRRLRRPATHPPR